MFEEIKDQFSKVIKYSQGIDKTDGIDKLFDQWYTAKNKFINRMNGKLIYEYPTSINFGLDISSQSSLINEFIDKLEGVWGNSDLANFVYDTKEQFFENRLSYDYQFDDKIIPKGMKLIKAYKFFENDTKALEDIQNEASRIIQLQKVEGIFCISVHPLDYLSLSENTHNWRSCHALDGEYRGGNLSYMVDNSTVICYLKSANEETLPNFPTNIKWNSKKWRCLIFFSEDENMMFAGRQYPFASLNGIEIIKNKLLPAAGITQANNWTDWTKEKINQFKFSEFKDRSLDEQVVSLDDKYIPVGSSLMRLNDLIVDGENTLHFNDLLQSSCYDPYYSYRRIMSPFPWTNSYTTGASTPASTVFHVGKECVCPCCGSGIVSCTNLMICNICETDYGTSDNDEWGYCYWCDSHIRYDDDIHWVDGNPVCLNCYHEYAKPCDECGELFMKNDLIFNRDSKKYYCAYCAQEENKWLKVPLPKSEYLAF